MSDYNHEELGRAVADRFFVAYHEAVEKAAPGLRAIPCKIDVPLDLVLRLMPIAEQMGFEVWELIPAVLEAFLEGEIEPIGTSGGAA